MKPFSAIIDCVITETREQLDRQYSCLYCTLSNVVLYELMNCRVI